MKETAGIAFREESVSQFQDRYYGSMSREINVNHETSQMRRALLNWRVESHIIMKRERSGGMWYFSTQF